MAKIFAKNYSSEDLQIGKQYDEFECDDQEFCNKLDEYITYYNYDGDSLETCLGFKITINDIYFKNYEKWN